MCLTVAFMWWAMQPRSHALEPVIPTPTPTPQTSCVVGNDLPGHAICIPANAATVTCYDSTAPPPAGRIIEMSTGLTCVYTAIGKTK